MTLKNYLESLTHVRGIDRKFTGENEPFPGAAKLVRQNLKENFEMHCIMNSKKLEEELISYYEQNGYCFLDIITDYDREISSRVEQCGLEMKIYYCVNAEEVLRVQTMLMPTKILITSGLQPIDLEEGLDN